MTSATPATIPEAAPAVAEIRETGPIRAALRSYGGKARLAPWIVAHLLPHICYVEPFGGAASVLLRKPPALCEVYNDLDGEVVGFFRVLRERPGDLVEAIRNTPFARAEIDAACAPAPPGLDDLERARRVYVRAWQGRHGLPARGRMGWRFERAAAGYRTAVAQWADLERLRAVAARLRHVQMECDDALRVIARFDGPESLFYSAPRRKAQDAFDAGLEGMIASTSMPRLAPADAPSTVVQPAPDVEDEVDIRRRLLPPYKVILHNDDRNRLPHVVKALQKSVPGMSLGRATAIMWEAHTSGKAIVITCPLELAELYQQRLRSFGLMATIEKDG